ncbi:MAG: hypothetical protein JJT77_05615, partial [Crocinitomicaceae bacterium]|nr:hypothetical protein [Crocinitomicaceae bacterium]
MNRILTAFKVMVIVFVGCLPINTFLSQTFDSAADGNWLDPASWAGGVAPALVNPGGRVTTSGHTIIENNPNTKTRGGDLELNGGGGGGSLVIRSGGILIVT